MSRTVSPRELARRRPTRDTQVRPQLGPRTQRVSSLAPDARRGVAQVAVETSPLHRVFAKIIPLETRTLP